MQASSKIYYEHSLFNPDTGFIKESFKKQLNIINPKGKSFSHITNVIPSMENLTFKLSYEQAQQFLALDQSNLLALEKKFSHLVIQGPTTSDKSRGVVYRRMKTFLELGNEENFPVSFIVNKLVFEATKKTIEQVYRDVLSNPNWIVVESNQQTQALDQELENIQSGLTLLSESILKGVKVAIVTDSELAYLISEIATNILDQHFFGCVAYPSMWKDVYQAEKEEDLPMDEEALKKITIQYAEERLEQKINIMTKEFHLYTQKNKEARNSLG